MQTNNPQSGFTIIELLATVMVAGILVAVAVPAFRDLITKTRMVTTTNDLVASFAYARNEAVRRAQSVRVVANAGGWENGWLILDQAGNRIRTFDPPAENVAIDAAGLDTFSFDSRGLLENQAVATFISLCDESGHLDAGRQIEISMTGRPKLNREYAGC
jgi:type IV fimbrial biogenesis protein FimT